MTEIDPELRDKIIETHTDMKHVRKALEKGDVRFAKHDTRIRRIEMWFVPVLALLSVVAHKVMNWLHLWQK